MADSPLESAAETPAPPQVSVDGPRPAKGPAARVKGQAAQQVEDRIWIANWCRPGGPEWGHKHCKGYTRNGALAVRELMLCECPACAGNDTHAHTPEQLAASKQPNPMAILSKRSN